MRVLFATSEFAPLVSVGGLAEASSGLVRALRAKGVEVTAAVPDYFGTELDNEQAVDLAVPPWASPARARTGNHPDIGPVTLIDVPGIRRPDPYTDADGQGWADNADRFFAFSAAVAALSGELRPDVVHCNDWHTGAVPGLMPEPLPTVLTIHTLGHQGWTSGGWLDRLQVGVDQYECYGGTNPLAGAIPLVDRVIAVSPGYAGEIVTPHGGFGLHDRFLALGDRLLGIRNGIDVTRWNPSTDDRIAARYGAEDPSGKDECRAALLDEIGWPDDGVPVVGMVTRVVDQKGIDLVLDSIRFARGIPIRVVLLGSGDRGLTEWARQLETAYPDELWFFDGFDRDLAHRVFAGSDLFAMPSRFEPCGLAQMQAMQYGSIPIVTPVGGLLDTVVDADDDRRRGTGFHARSVDVPGVLDALHRGVRAWRNTRRRAGIRRRGMEHDWSWDAPADRHIAVYREISQDA